MKFVQQHDPRPGLSSCRSVIFRAWIENTQAFPVQGHFWPLLDSAYYRTVYMTRMWVWIMWRQLYPANENWISYFRLSWWVGRGRLKTIREPQFVSGNACTPSTVIHFCVYFVSQLHTCLSGFMQHLLLCKCSTGEVPEAFSNMITFDLNFGVVIRGFFLGLWGQSLVEISLFCTGLGVWNPFDVRSLLILFVECARVLWVVLKCIAVMHSL